jgi:hypothetical protein
MIFDEDLPQGMLGLSIAGQVRHGGFQATSGGYAAPD